MEDILNGFSRAMLCISAAYAVVLCVCVCVCVSVCLSRSWIVSQNKHNIKFFSPLGSDTILVFPCQTGGAIFRRKLP